MGRVQTFQEFVCNIPRSKSDLKISGNNKTKWSPRKKKSLVTAIVGAIGKI